MNNKPSNDRYHPADINTLSELISRMETLHQYVVSVTFWYRWNVFFYSSRFVYWPLVIGTFFYNELITPAFILILFVAVGVVIGHFMERLYHRRIVKLCRMRITIMGELAVVDKTGDTKLIWDKNKLPEVEAARTMFKTLRDKNYIAYTVKDNGKKGKVIQEFDADLERIIMIPGVVGG